MGCGRGERAFHYAASSCGALGSGSAFSRSIRIDADASQSIGLDDVRRARVRRAVGWAASAVFSCHAAAQPLQVAQLDCRNGVQLSSRGVPFSQVLRQMASVMNFKLKYWAHEDPPINHSSTNIPLDLMNALSSNANLIVRYAPDRRCPGQWRVRNVWVLPGSHSASLTPGDSAARPASAAPVTIPIDKANQEQMHAHGVAPPLNALRGPPSVDVVPAASTRAPMAAQPQRK